MSDFCAALQIRWTAPATIEDGTCVNNASHWKDHEQVQESMVVASDNEDAMAALRAHLESALREYVTAHRDELQQGYFYLANVFPASEGGAT